MFYLLMIVGIGFILLGNFIERNSNKMKKEDEFINEIEKEDSISNVKVGKKENQLLEKRIDILEEMLFKKTLEEESEKNIVLEEKIEEDSLEQYKLIKKYEKEGKSIDEISRLLYMNKGEVLLLKSLYKNL